MMESALIAMSVEVSSPFLAKVDPGILFSGALLAGLVYAVASARRHKLDARKMYWSAVYAILFGLWGAHLLGLLVHGLNHGPVAMVSFWQDGKSLYGGLLLGGLAAGFYMHRKALPVLSYADAAMPALALGYAIGRIGCFLNGDDYGTLSHVPWAVVYPPGTEAYQAHLERGWISAGDAWSLPIHPVQLYSSLLGLALFVFLATRRPKWEGGRICAYLILYGVGRFSLEFFRGDFRSVAGPFSLPQAFSLCFILFGVFLWLRRTKTQASEVSRSPAADLTRSSQWQAL
jgi:phosphatidylglycerol---prolipoprotein diacylglyceryl transferase